MIERLLNRLERRFGEIYIPHFAYVLVGLKLVGLVLMRGNPQVYARLIFIPEKVLQGEWWRLLGFLCIPETSNLFWLFFELYLLVLFVNGLEQRWGAFRVNVYYLCGYVLSVSFSLLTGWTLGDASYLNRTLMLAFAALYPNFPLYLFFIISVPIKWLALLIWAWMAYTFITAPWMGRIFLLVIISNYLLFFGPSHWQSVKQYVSNSRRKKRFHDQLNNDD